MIYLCILLFLLAAYAMKERKEMFDKLGRKCVEYDTLEAQRESQVNVREDEIKRLSEEVANSYMERLKLERQLEHLATGPNAIYRDNVRLQKELLAARTALLPQQTEELRKMGYLSE